MLDGNVTGSIRSDIQNQNTVCFRTDAGVTNIKSNQPVIANYFTCLNNISDVEHIRYTGIVEYRFQIFLLKTTATTANQVIAWLNNHNTIVYYILETPTYTIITEQALIDQLEAIKYSMNGTTIITQTNEDKPFELDVKALRGE